MDKKRRTEVLLNCMDHAKYHDLTKNPKGEPEIPLILFLKECKKTNQQAKARWFILLIPSLILK